MDPAPKHASPTSESTAHPPANPNLTAMPHLNPTPATKMPTPMPMTPIMTMIILMILIIGGVTTFETNLNVFSCKMQPKLFQTVVFNLSNASYHKLITSDLFALNIYI